jgi:uridine kinase
MATAFTSTKKTPFLIGVTGGTSCGKTEVCRAIVSQLDNRLDQAVVNGKVSILSQECFYKSLSEEEKLSVDRGEYNLDHPDAFDTELMVTTLKHVYEGRTVHVPRYDLTTCQRLEEMDVFRPTEVVLFEGILVLYYREVRDLLHMKLFVDLDSDTRLCRRVEKDIKERGRTLNYVLKQYTDLVKPAFEEFTLPVC